MFGKLDDFLLPQHSVLQDLFVSMGKYKSVSIIIVGTVYSKLTVSLTYGFPDPAHRAAYKTQSISKINITKKIGTRIAYWYNYSLQIPGNLTFILYCIVSSIYIDYICNE